MLGKLVGLGLALSGHVAKLLGGSWFAAARHLPHLDRRQPQKYDRLADGIGRAPSHCTPQSADLHDNRDLKPTTDLRSVLKGLLRDHLRVDERHLEATVFPDSAAARPTEGLLA